MSVDANVVFAAVQTWTARVEVVALAALLPGTTTAFGANASLVADANADVTRPILAAILPGLPTVVLLAHVVAIVEHTLAAFARSLTGQVFVTPALGAAGLTGSATFTANVAPAASQAVRALPIAAILTCTTTLSADPTLLTATSAAAQAFTWTALSLTAALSSCATIVASALTAHPVVATTGRTFGTARVADATPAASAHITRTALFTRTTTRRTNPIIASEFVFRAGLLSATRLSRPAASRTQIAQTSESFATGLFTFTTLLARGTTLRFWVGLRSIVRGGSVRRVGSDAIVDARVRGVTPPAVVRSAHALVVGFRAVVARVIFRAGPFVVRLRGGVIVWG